MSRPGTPLQARWSHNAGSASPFRALRDLPTTQLALDFERALLIAPSDDFVATLPDGRIPDRRDFVKFTDAEHMRRWERAVKQANVWATNCASCWPRGDSPIWCARGSAQQIAALPIPGACEGAYNQPRRLPAFGNPRGQCDARSSLDVRAAAPGRQCRARTHGRRAATHHKSEGGVRRQRRR